MLRDVSTVVPGGGRTQRALEPVAAVVLIGSAATALDEGDPPRQAAMRVTHE